MICECRTRKAFMEERFPQIRHVILDEVHNFQAEEGDWLGKARTLVKQHLQRESSDDKYASDKEGFFSESETEQDNSDTNFVAGLDPEYSIWKNDGPGYLWCFMDKAQSISKKLEIGIPKRPRHKFLLTKVIRNSKRIFERAQKFLDRRIWPFPESSRDREYLEFLQSRPKSPFTTMLIEREKRRNDVRKEKSVTIGHDFDGEQSEVTYSKGERIACLIEVLESLLKEGYSKGDIAVLCLTEPLEGNELKQLQEFTLTVNAERNDDDNIVLSTVMEYGGLERPVVVIVAESFDYNSQDMLPKRVKYCAITRGMVKVITLSLKKNSRGQKRKESN